MAKSGKGAGLTGFTPDGEEYFEDTDSGQEAGERFGEDNKSQ